MSKIANPVARVSLVTIIGNILLTGFKIFAGIAGGSGAMLSDAVHSLSDVLTTVIAWVGVRCSEKAPDREHPYGHERLESAASLLLGVILSITAAGIGLSGLKQILGSQYAQLPVPGPIALAAAAVSIAVKEAMYWYTRHYAQLMGSTAFMADAWHHRSDALSSIGSLIGIGGAMLGWPVMDPLASIAICLCILKVAVDILRDALKKMLDTACPEEFQDRVRQSIRSHDSVAGISSLRTRMFGSKVFIDAEICVDGSMSLRQAHDIAQQVHDTVERDLPNIKHIMIHVDPD